MLILQAVPRFGWSDEKHTKMLIQLGALDHLEDGSEVETVKKFIRDLRRRYQKYRERQGSALCIAGQRGHSRAKKRRVASLPQGT